MGLIADVRAGCLTVLDEVKAANPTLLGEVYTARPASLGLPIPCAYVGDFRGNLSHTVHIRQWSGTEQDIVLVFPAWDNAEQQEQADTLVQLLLDAWPQDGHFAHANMVGSPVRVRTATELERDGTSYPAVVVTIGSISTLETR
jgi:hypothetical protein